MWDLTANACSCELVPEVGTAVRSLTVALDGSLVVAANNAGAPVLRPAGQRRQGAGAWAGRRVGRHPSGRRPEVYSGGQAAGMHRPTAVRAHSPYRTSSCSGLLDLR